jgi:dihydrodipicolinate synthase/N-acetylneuraminate lyase
MEELLTLKELLHQGNITEALLIVKELEELSKLVQQEEIIKKAMNLIWEREIDA